MSAPVEEFRKAYDPAHDYSFVGVKFRAGAPFSVSPDGTPCVFALGEGFRHANGSLTWGHARFHLGTDRAAGEVFVPFDADRVVLYDDGGLIYGTQLRLISEQWGFEVRIAHMDPRAGDIDAVTMLATRQNQGILRGIRIGQAGCYGIGAGKDARHTHTEVVSIGTKSSLLDDILVARFGQAVGAEYSRAEVVGEYRRHAHFVAETDEVIWHDYERERRDKGLLWCNRFRALRWDSHAGRNATWYSSALVFDGM